MIDFTKSFEDNMDYLSDLCQRLDSGSLEHEALLASAYVEDRVLREAGIASQELTSIRETLAKYAVDEVKLELPEIKYPAKSYYRHYREMLVGEAYVHSRLPVLMSVTLLLFLCVFGIVGGESARNLITCGVTLLCLVVFSVWSIYEVFCLTLCMFPSLYIKHKGGVLIPKSVRNAYEDPLYCIRHNYTDLNLEEKQRNFAWLDALLRLSDLGMVQFICSGSLKDLKLQLNKYPESILVHARIEYLRDHYIEGVS